jgi:transposase
VSGIVYVIKHGLQWKDAPKGYGPHKTLYNLFIRWSRLGVFEASSLPSPTRAPSPSGSWSTPRTWKRTARRRACSKKRDVPRRIGRTKGGLNSKLHAVCDGEGRPIIRFLSEGQMSDHKGARLVLDALPAASSLIADRGYDSDWFRAELQDRGIEPCIPSSRSRKVPYAHDKAVYRERHKV